MNYIAKFFVSTAALLLLSILTASVALAQDPANGKTLWEAQTTLCQRCHGPAGEGGWGAPLAGNQNPVQDWITQVRTPRRSMPMFSPQQISDEQITDIHAYLTSLPAPTSVTRPDAGLPPDAPPGQVLIVEKRCVACHTTTGPINGFIQRKEIPTADLVIAQLRSPRNMMPTFSDAQVSDADAAVIAEFLASQVSSQLPPATLPSSGSETTTPWPALLTLIGCGLIALGLILHRRLASRLS
jgi:mono/diheme cytochrome c family protein